MIQVKAVELQLEEEHEEKQKAMREKRELERQIQALSEQRPARDRGEYSVLACNTALTEVRVLAHFATLAGNGLLRPLEIYR